MLKYLQVERKCCQDFVPTKAMLDRFTSQMYIKYQENDNTGLDQVSDMTQNLADQDYQDIITLFNTDGEKCITV